MELAMELGIVNGSGDKVWLDPVDHPRVRIRMDPAVLERIRQQNRTCGGCGG